MENLTQYIKENKMDARELHTMLESNRDFPTWMKEKIRQADLREGIDFTTSKGKSTGGRPSIQYTLTIESVKELCLLQQTPQAHKLRRELIELSNKVESHQLIDAKKAAFAMVLINTFKFGEYQLQAEELHKDRFTLTFHAADNVHKLFAEHRNALPGINNEELKQGLVDAFNRGLVHKPKAKNIRGRIALLDRYKLIRDAVADYLISTGADVRDSVNFADTVKEIAKFAGIEIRIKDEDTLFQEKENASAPLFLQLTDNTTPQLK